MALWAKEDSAAGAPKWLQSEADPTPHAGMTVNANAVFPNDIDDAVFVDEAEAAVDAVRAKGLKTPGWHVYDTYTTSDGATRHKSECLVAMGEAAASEAIGDAGVTGDTAVEDAIVPDADA